MQVRPRWKSYPCNNNYNHVDGLQWLWSMYCIVRCILIALLTAWAFQKRSQPQQPRPSSRKASILPMRHHAQNVGLLLSHLIVAGEWKLPLSIMASKFNYNLEFFLNPVHLAGRGQLASFDLHLIAKTILMVSCWLFEAVENRSLVLDSPWSSTWTNWEHGIGSPLCSSSHWAPSYVQPGFCVHAWFCTGLLSLSLSLIRILQRLPGSVFLSYMWYLHVCCPCSDLVARQTLRSTTRWNWWFRERDYLLDRVGPSQSLGSPLLMSFHESCASCLRAI